MVVKYLLSAWIFSHATGGISVKGIHMRFHDAKNADATDVFIRTIGADKNPPPSPLAVIVLTALVGAASWLLILAVGAGHLTK
jgi:RsiW-degrading membrane proteinase PrsW (M82 family)